MFKINNQNWYSESDIPEGFPLLDLKNMSREEQRDCFVRAAAGAHCLYIKNHTIENQEIEEILDRTIAFFNQPEIVKAKYVKKRTEMMRGYYGYNQKSLSAVFDVDDYQGDIYQYFSWGGYGNLYPDLEFKRIWENYYNKCLALSKTVFELIVEYLAVHDTLNWEHVHCGEHLLKVHDYPAIKSDQAYRLLAHGDTSFLTLLYQTPADNGFIGLEVEVGDQFVGVPAVNGTLLINFGEPMLSLSQGRLKPAIHRVANPKDNFHGSARFSIPFFLAVNPDTKLYCYEGSTYKKYYDSTGTTLYGDFLKNCFLDYARSK